MKLFFRTLHFSSLLILLSLVLNISAKASGVLAKHNPPGGDSVLDYVRMIYDEAGNLETSELVYKKNPTPPEDSVLGQQFDTVSRVKPTDMINDASLTMDERRYLDSIAKMIYVFPNPNSTGVLSIKWDVNIRSLMKDFVISPSSSQAGDMVQSVSPMHGMDEVVIMLRNGVSGLYILQCRLTNGKILKIKIMKN